MSAADLVNARVAPLPGGAVAEAALAAAVAAGASVLLVEPGRAVLREDLVRALALGLGGVPGERLARPLPVVARAAGELDVRRRLASGAPAVLVADGREGVGAVTVSPGEPATTGMSAARLLRGILDAEVEAVLGRVGRLARQAGAHAYAVGGLVRDALRALEPVERRDVDVVIVGDGGAVARLLASELNARLTEHERFMTASLTTATALRIDVATGRAEHYDAPGALPRVRPAGIGADLRRRDFAVNAMAVDLGDDARPLLDPLGGRTDLGRRRLRVLHPLSFVEDPTRLFRAERYAARLGFRLDTWTRECGALALDLLPYDALSGARVQAELTLLLGEPRAETALVALGRAGVYRLLDARFRFTAATVRRVRGLAEARAWTAARGLPVGALELLLVALLADQAPDVGRRVLLRLGLTGEPRARVERALALAGSRAPLRAGESRSARARALRERSPLELGWLWLDGDTGTRQLLGRAVDEDLTVAPWLSGDDLAALGVRGPAVARLLGELRDGRLDGTLRDREAAEAYVRRWRAAGVGTPGRGERPDAGRGEVGAKYIFVTGGVVSSLGKGLASAAIGALLEARGLRVSLQKMDPYINVDAGTMSPYQHGEVFVTDDGGETDLDLGHYERFTSPRLTRDHNITAGKIYFSVIQKERRGDYLGRTVQVIPHITDEIKACIRRVGDAADVAIVEVGGTVGDIESLPFLEAIRQIKKDVGKDNCIYVHLTLVPFMRAASELKTKATQHSVKELRAIGIQPDVLLCRTDRFLPPGIKAKIALFCDVEEDAVITAKDVDSIYEVPLVFHREGLDEIIIRLLDLPRRPTDLARWEAVVRRVMSPRAETRIAVVGKYVELKDSYKSLVEALAHGGIANDARVEVAWVDAEQIEREGAARLLEGVHGVLVPGGFGDRGIEGKIMAVRHAREQGLPFFGICLGMQCAVIEYARNVCDLARANSSEFDPEAPHRVIDLLPEQRAVADKGGTMRLGVYPIVLAEGSRASRLYGQGIIRERHRHRYEVNNDYVQRLEKGGLRVSGVWAEKQLVEIVEIPEHPYFVAGQFHPEFRSRPWEPHPLFAGFVAAALEHQARA